MAEIDALGPTDLRAEGSADVADRHLAQILQGVRGDFERSTAQPAPLRGRTLGRYLVLGKLGQGGMGTVLKAYDESLDRAVAIKLLHSEGAERHALRLKREAQALAKLSHPNIVHVYEVGESEGQWFIAMELVPGQTLRQWWQDAPRSWKDCVKVYLQAGEGLAAAHSAGLVHRDFKPDNCIIDGKGRPRVLDFGLVGGAKLPPGDDAVSDADLQVMRSGAVDASLTSTGTVMGTPAYMPPEQMNGLEADARSDQFSFCVALYEAVYGKRPFAGRSMLELSVAMADGRIEPPPKRTPVPNALRRALLRGLVTDPTLRWPSMEALLDTLRPLVIPRRRRWIALSVGVGLMAIGAGSATGELADRIERCTGARAELEGIWDDARKQEVGAAMLGTNLSNAPATWARVQPQLDEYANAWVTEHTEVCEASTVRGEQSPEVMDLRMSCLYDRKVALREAVKVLAAADETRVENAAKLVEALPGLSRCADVEALEAELPPPEDPEIAKEVEALREQLAAVWALEAAGAGSRTLLPKVDAVLERAEALEYEPLLAEILARRSHYFRVCGEYVQAEADAERAYALGIEHGHARAAIDAAMVLVRLVGIELGRHEAGLQWGRAALALTRGPQGTPKDVAEMLHDIGMVLTWQGKLPEALDHLQRALAIQQEIVGLHPSNLSASHDAIGLVLVEQGKLPEALDHHRRALAIRHEGLSPLHSSYGVSLYYIGAVLSMQGKLPEALDHLQRALAILEKEIGHHNAFIALPLDGIGSVLRQQGKLEEALDYHQRALAIEQKVLTPLHPILANSLAAIASVLSEQGKLPEALDHLQRALAIRRQTLDPGHPEIADALHDIGLVLRKQEKLPEALDHLQRALAIRHQALGPRHPLVAESLMTLAKLAMAQGDQEVARQYAKRAVVLFEACEATPLQLTMARSTLAEVEQWLAERHVR